MTAPSIAPQALHYWLWVHRTGPTVKVNLKELAPIMGISSEGLRSALGRLETYGRIRKTPHKYVYEVEDPADFVD